MSKSETGSSPSLTRDHDRDDDHEYMVPDMLPRFHHPSRHVLDFCPFPIFLIADAANYLLCCVHLDAKFSATLIHAGPEARPRKHAKRPKFDRKQSLGKLGGCKFGGGRRHFHPAAWMSKDENGQGAGSRERGDRGLSRKRLTLGGTPRDEG